ncbi:MAG TPA: hypothetical protein VME22_02500 [Solirubrobacteraceae bacterium]|nr:hypothetical protein [Solirubrobacteraceae bacterium]
MGEPDSQHATTEWASFGKKLRAAGATALSALQGRTPKRLYHYTTFAGLDGILSQTAIWASDIRFMGDSSELSYALDLVRKVVAAQTAHATHEDLKELIAHAPDPMVDPFGSGLARPCASCFCEDGDLLSQWKRCRPGEVGYSLGLELQMIDEFWAPPDTVLRRVIYEESQQRRITSALVRAWIEIAEAMMSRGVAFDRLFPDPAIPALNVALSEPMLCFKDPACAGDAEWRLIKIIHLRDEIEPEEEQRTGNREARPPLPPGLPSPAERLDIRFRPTADGLVPYVEIPVLDRAGVFANRLPLAHVVQGRTSHPKLSAHALELYLDTRGYGSPHTTVQPSAIP